MLILRVMERDMKTTEKLIGGMTQAELAKAVAACVKAFNEYVAETGVDPLAEFYKAANGERT
jgi:hypothetical protein